MPLITIAKKQLLPPERLSTDRKGKTWPPQSDGAKDLLMTRIRTAGF